MDSFSYQGISDRIAWGYLEAHGNANWDLIEASLAEARCACPKLGSFETYQKCGFRKSSATCAQPIHNNSCPVPRLPLRKGDLNQLAFSLYYFLRDRCDGDLVAFIDRLFAEVDADKPDNPVEAKRAALVAELSAVYAISDKLIAMTFAVLLMAGDPRRKSWVAVGRSFIAIDTLVHNFLHRTGVLSAYGCEHSYGASCYGKAGCVAILHDIASQIDARHINPNFPRTFPRLVQFAIWAFCAQTQTNMCNGRRIDDRFACTQSDCPVGRKCSRIPLRPPAPP